MEEKEKNKPFRIQLVPSLLSRLTKIAAKKSLPLPELINLVLLDFIEGEEDSGDFNRDF